MDETVIRCTRRLAALLLTCALCNSTALAEVGSQGSFQTQVAIALPGGIQGVKPNIVLAYDSNAGDGIAGIGWDLGGIPSIERIEPRTGYSYSVHDDFRDADGDLYPMKDVAAGEYRFGNRRENWLIYRAKSGCAGEVCSWTVTDRGGNTLTFGGTPDSITYFNSPVGTIPRAWFLSEYRDRAGNFYTISYQRSTPLGTILPSVIEYTKNMKAEAAGRQYAHWEVTFTYEPRPAPLVTTEQGFPVRINSRLKGVTTALKAPNSASRVFRAYSLRYAASTTQSRLASIEETGTGGSAESLRTEFAWQESVPVMAVSSNVNLAATVRDGISQWAHGTGSAATRLIDQNGDGIQDLLVVDKTTISVLHGSVLGGPLFAGRVVSTMSDVALTNALFADFNGDGYVDLLNPAVDGGATRVFLGQRDGTFIANPALSSLGATLGFQKDPTGQKLLIGDIDADGREDAIFLRDGQPTKIAYSPGPSQPLGKVEDSLADDAPAQWTPSKATMLVLMDFNGDGKSDLFRCGKDGRSFLRLWQNVPNQPFGQPIEVGPSVKTECSAPEPLLELADLNNDGQLDVLVRSKIGDAIDMHTFRQATFVTSNVKLTRNIPAAPIASFQGDFTGDGATDLLYVDCDLKGCTASLYPWEGTAFAQSPIAFSDFPAGATAADLFVPGDFDGDRTVDLLYAKRSNSALSRDAFKVILGSALGLRRAEFDVREEPAKNTQPQSIRWDRRPVPLVPTQLSVDGAPPASTQWTFFADDLAIPFVTDLDGDGRSDILVAGNASKQKLSFALTSRFVSHPKLAGILSPSGAITSVSYERKRTDIVDAEACTPKLDEPLTCGLRDLTAVSVVKAIATWTHQPRSVWTGFTQAPPDELMTYIFSTPTYFPSGPQGPAWVGFRRVVEKDETRQETIERVHHQDYLRAGLMAEERKWFSGELHSRTSLTHRVIKSSNEDAARTQGTATLIESESTALYAVGTLSARRWREHSFEFGYTKGSRDCLARIIDNIEQSRTCFDMISDVAFPEGPHRPILTGVRRQTVPNLGSNEAPTILDWTRFTDSTARGEPLLTESRLLCADAERCASEADGRFYPVSRIMARDDFGQPTRTKDVLGRDAQTTYDAMIPEAVEKQTDVLGLTTTLTLDEWGRAKSSTDANGGVTRYAYDGLGRLSRTDHATAGTFERRVRVNEGDATLQYVELTKSNDDVGNTTVTRDYMDGAGSIYRSTRPGPTGRDIVVERSSERSKGLLTTYESEAFFGDSPGPFRWQAASFDALGRLIYSRWVRSSKPRDRLNAKPEAQQAQRIEYRGSDLKIVRDGRPLAIVERLDEQGRVVERVRATEDPNSRNWTEHGTKTLYRYDAAGRLTAVEAGETDGSNLQSIRQKFDSWGRRVALVDRFGGGRTFGVRLDGEIELENHANGASITRSFQADGRLQSVTSLPDNRVFTFAYDEAEATNGKGRLTHITSGSRDEWQFSYDEMGRISQKTITVDGLQRRKFIESFSYDGAGRVATKKMPEGTLVSYRYSPVGPLAAVQVNGLEVARWEDFDAEGRPAKRVTRGSVPGIKPEIETKYHFTGSQLDSVIHTRGANEGIAEAHYSFKPTGEIDTIRTAYPTAKSQRTRYDYNALGQLESADAKPGTKAIFTYNAFGDVEAFGGRKNRNLRYRDNDDAKGYSICDEVGEGGCRNSWVFDEKGQLATHIDDQQEQQRFVFGVDGLLLSVTDADGTKQEYDYDALGLRTRSTRSKDGEATLVINYIGPDFEIHSAGDQDANQRYSLHISTPDGTRLTTITTKPSGNLALRMTPLMSLPSIDKTTATSGLPPVGTWFYHVNHLSSIWFVTDAQSNVVYRATFLPYGEPMEEVGDPISAFAFTGARADQGTGLIYMSGRYYDPRIGRFVSPDPFLVSSLGDASSGNRYAYANNQPLNYVDPSGYGWRPDRDLRNARDDLVRDTRNLGRHLEAGVRDLGRTVESIVRETGRGARQFGKDLGRDPLYALVHLPRYTVRYPERALRNGLLQSEELTVVAMVAVSIVSGPIGTGAFTAYMTYAAGGSIEDAAKAGVIAWATSSLMSAVDPAYSGSDEIVSRVIAKGTISGASAVARGGSFEAGFRAGATSAAIAETMTALTQKAPTYAAGTDSRLKPKDYSLEDLRSDHLLKHVGMQVSKKGTSLVALAKFHVLSEGGWLMDTVADAPGMSYLGYVHDYFVMSLERATNSTVANLFNQTTIASAIAVNYHALGLHRDRMLLEISMRQ